MYISTKTWTSALMKACLQSTNDGKARWTSRRASKMPVSYKIGEWQNRELFLIFLLSFLFFFFFILSKRFIPRQLNQRSEYYSINNTNELHLLISSPFSFGWKTIDKMTKCMLYTNEFKEKQYGHCLRRFLLLYNRLIGYRVSMLLQEGPFTFVVNRLGHFNPQR